MKIFRSVFDLLFETWKWSNIVSKSKLMLLLQQRKVSRSKEIFSSTDAVIVPSEPKGNDLVVAQKIVNLVTDEIDFVKKTPLQKETWLDFGATCEINPSIRYHVVKYVHEKSGIIPKWIASSVIEIIIP